MRYISFASGSSGNCALALGRDAALLVDAGISMKRIRENLRARDLTLADLGGILITHEHYDHIGGLVMLCKYTDVPVYTSAGTARALLRLGKCAEKNLRVLEPGDSLCLGGLRVRGFETPHDAAQPMGYRLEDAGGALAVVTDLGCLTQGVLSAVSGCAAAVVEFNHDEELLRHGSYPYPLKMRILGNRGHLSNEAGAELGCRLAEGGAKELLLAHLSKENNRPDLALAAAHHRLGQAVRIQVAPRDQAGTELCLC